MLSLWENHFSALLSLSVQSDFCVQNVQFSRYLNFSEVKKCFSAGLHDQNAGLIGLSWVVVYIYIVQAMCFY